MISIVLRTKNEERDLPRVLDALSQQQGVEFELVVVDSGSSDRTLELVRPKTDRILEIPAEEFSYGRALNLGCREARGEILVFLSAHCTPIGRYWLAELTDPIRSGEVDATGGAVQGTLSAPKIGETTSPVHLDLGMVLNNYNVGISNSNAALSREAFERVAFNEQLTGCEDKEWTRRALESGLRILLTPAANVDHILQREDFRASYLRGYREHRAYREYLPSFPISPLSYLLRSLLSPFGKHLGNLTSDLLSPRRWGTLLGHFDGQRGRKIRGNLTNR